MPPLSARRLIDALLRAYEEAGASAVPISWKAGNPKRLVVQTGVQVFEVWAYLWTLTHGGGAARPTAEYRIQLTGVPSPLQLNLTGGPTLLLGFEPNTRCFAGFDVSKHLAFSTKSPSVQIPITALYDALQHGLSFVRKGNDEIAIGVRPDQLLMYTINAATLHREGADADVTQLLTKVSALEEVTDQDVSTLPPERKRLVQTVARLSRDASFRQTVVTAYGRRCAVTRMQLELIDAAHILPVGVAGSTDLVNNGICLSPTYHRAFDRGLIYLDTSLRMRLNPARVKELQDMDLVGGLEDFSRYLDIRIHLPPDRRQWPDTETIRQANEIRGIPTNT